MLRHVTSPTEPKRSETPLVVVWRQTCGVMGSNPIPIRPGTGHSRLAILVVAPPLQGLQTPMDRAPAVIPAGCVEDR
jgi:hypothetical protein